MAPPGRRVLRVSDGDILILGDMLIRCALRSWPGMMNGICFPKDIADILGLIFYTMPMRLI